MYSWSISMKNKKWCECLTSTSMIKIIFDSLGMPLNNCFKPITLNLNDFVLLFKDSAKIQIQFLDHIYMQNLLYQFKFVDMNSLFDLCVFADTF